MPRRLLPVIAALGLLACEPSEPEIEISVEMSPLIAAEAVRAVVALFPATPPASCAVILVSEKDESMPERAVYRSTVTLDDTPPYQTDFFDLVPGDYQIAVFVYDSSSDLIGFGCRPTAVTIRLGERAEAPAIEVNAVP